MKWKRNQKSLDDIEDTDFRKSLPIYVQNFDKLLGIAHKLKEIGKKYNNATSSQIALAWLLSRGDNIIPIPGTRSVQVCSLHYFF